MRKILEVFETGLNSKIPLPLLYILIFINIQRSAESHKFNLSFT